MKRVALYVRVSTAEQRDHGMSVDSQITALKEYAKENRFTVAGVYNDAGISARKSYKHRPGLLQLIEDCNNNKIDMILFTKLDRWFRSVKDYYAVMEQIGDVPWRAIWEDYETETSSGIFKVNIMLSVAQAESDRTGERIRSILEYKRELGQYIGTAPTGYKCENHHLVFDETTYPGMRAFLVAFCEGKKMLECLEAAKENGLYLKMEVAYHLLNNPAYTGKTKNGYPCPSYLSAEELELFNKRKSERIRSTKNERVYIFQGLAKCPYCGKNLTCSGRYSKNKAQGVYYYKYYQCKNYNNSYPYERCKGHTISEEKLENLVMDVIEEELDNYKVVMESEASTSNYRLALTKIAKLQNKLSRIGERYDDGDLSRNEYKRKRDEIKAEIEELKKVEKPKSAPELPNKWRQQYRMLTLEEKAVYWKKMISAIYYYADKHIEIKF